MVKRKAIPKADDYVDKTIDLLNDDPRSSHYKKWFGKWNEDRYKLVKSHYRKIDHDADDTTYDGDCDDDSYAYVYPDYPDHIWLCKAFWDAPTTGDDSQAGTIVHEQSHFTVNGGTEDFAYGHEACKNLAEDHPGKAVMNADSHEYFAEKID
jgi:peptidyl-Lys metalloendopeptidase